MHDLLTSISLLTSMHDHRVNGILYTVIYKRGPYIVPFFIHRFTILLRVRVCMRLDAHEYVLIRVSMYRGWHRVTPIHETLLYRLQNRMQFWPKWI